MIFNEPFKSPENLTPEQSEGDPEPVELLSDEPSDWSPEESSDDQAEQGWKRTMINQDIVCRFIAEFNKPNERQ